MIWDRTGKMLEMVEQVVIPRRGVLHPMAAGKPLAWQQLD